MLTKDEMLDDITLYWVTNTAISSARLYWENNANNFNAVDIALPAAVTVFPGEIYRAPWTWAERSYHKLIYWNEVDRGGHFAAWEQPELFSRELRAAFRPLRQTREGLNVRQHRPSPPPFPWRDGHVFCRRRAWRVYRPRRLAGASFGPLKQIDAGVLTVGYAEAGPVDGPAVLLLHGWPYDIQSYADVAPVLGVGRAIGVIVPYLRGYGTTRFLSDHTVRNGQQAAVAVDIVALMDALKIEKAILGGYDWGARTANVIAALWPERCTAMVSVSGYLIGSQQANRTPLPPPAELQWWYQYYFATDRGRAGYEKYRRDFAKLIWRIASPKWNFEDATFDRTRCVPSTIPTMSPS